MENGLTFGEWLKKRRRQLDMTQKELAYASGCSDETIRKIERNARRPSKQLARLMAAALEIPDEQQAAFLNFARMEAYLTPMPEGLSLLKKNASLPLLQSPLANGRQPPHNLPSQPTPFIGRNLELETLNDFLSDPEKRLVTILGPGGMGKTRLAIACAEYQLTQNRFPDGIFFISMARLSEPKQITTAVAETVDLFLNPGGQQHHHKLQLLEYLSNKRLLLILDNFEHLLQGASLINEMVAHGTKIGVIVTSRRRLSLRSEHLFSLGGLTFPVENVLDSVTQYSAVKLFIKSAQRIIHNFHLTDLDITHLSHICRLVDGMPLAIELAAVWVETLSLAEIAAEIQKSLDILETTNIDVAERHRSIRAVLNYSWRKLTPDEQEIFSKLSITEDGFTRDAAHQIAGASIRQLQKLVNNSFLRYERKKKRYYFHELLRQYGQEMTDPNQLLINGQAHCEYFLNFVADRKEEVFTQRQGDLAETIKADFFNIRAAWIWALEHQNLELIDRSWSGLRDALRVTSLTHLNDLSQMALSFLKPKEGEKPHPIWLRLLSQHPAPRQKEIPYLQVAIDYFEKENKEEDWAQAMASIGWAYIMSGSPDKGVALLEQGIQRLKSLGLLGLVYSWQRNQGMGYYFAGKLKKAYATLEESFFHNQELGNLFEAAGCKSNLIRISFAQGKYDVAINHLEEYSELVQQNQHLQTEINRIELLLWNTYFSFLRGEHDQRQSLIQEIKLNMRGTQNWTITWPDLFYALNAAIHGAYHKALNLFNKFEKHKQENIGPFEILMFHWGKSICYWELNDEMNMLEETRSGFKIASEADDLRAIHLMLPIVSLLIANLDPINATAYLSLAYAELSKEWSGWLRNWSIFSSLQKRLHVACGDEVYQAAWTHGESLDFWETIKEIQYLLHTNESI